jgi:hypothetical protein
MELIEAQKKELLAKENEIEAKEKTLAVLTDQNNQIERKIKHKYNFFKATILLVISSIIPVSFLICSNFSDRDIGSLSLLISIIMWGIPIILSIIFNKKLDILFVLKHIKVSIENAEYKKACFNILDYNSLLENVKNLKIERSKLQIVIDAKIEELVDKVDRDGIGV